MEGRRNSRRKEGVDEQTFEEGLGRWPGYLACSQAPLWSSLPKKAGYQGGIVQYCRYELSAITSIAVQRCTSPTSSCVSPPMTRHVYIHAPLDEVPPLRSQVHATALLAPAETSSQVSPSRTRHGIPEH